MIELLTGLVILFGVLQLMYWTGRLTGRWPSDSNIWDEKDYLGKGIAIWFVFCVVFLITFTIGKLVFDVFF